MSKGIRVSEKYGLNPTIGICFFCGKETGEIGIMGRVTNGKRGRACEEIEAPKYSVLSYEPCDDCKDVMKSGVTLIEVSTDVDDSRPPIDVQNGQGLYPTGHWYTLKTEAAERIFGQDIAKHSKAFVEVGVLQQLGIQKGE